MTEEAVAGTRFNWEKGSRERTIKEAVRKATFTISQGEAVDIIRQRVRERYALANNVEIKISMLDPERSDDAFIVELIEVIE